MTRSHGHYVFEVPSKSRPGEVQEVRVDDSTGRVWCSCEAFFFRYGPHEPDLTTPARWCRHIREALGPAFCK